MIIQLCHVQTKGVCKNWDYLSVRTLNSSFRDISKIRLFSGRKIIRNRMPYNSPVILCYKFSSVILYNSFRDMAKLRPFSDANYVKCLEVAKHMVF
eukprot:UN20045